MTLTKSGVVVPVIVVTSAYPIPACPTVFATKSVSVNLVSKE